MVPYHTRYRRVTRVVTSVLAACRRRANSAAGLDPMPPKPKPKPKPKAVKQASKAPYPGFKPEDKKKHLGPGHAEVEKSVVNGE